MVKRATRQEGALPVVEREHNATIQDLYACNWSQLCRCHVIILRLLIHKCCQLTYRVVRSVARRLDNVEAVMSPLSLADSRDDDA